ncbi:MAG: pyridoxal phosphate-dependent aminotransferase [Pelagibacteraceae bacterium]|nr:pyridoxal phosphate-dependent aminotransferase [Pelagibacteraceae bacterium]NCW79346.1 pyridoxal phosphate-dependent aminotransferase [Pelagibacteraceae bacterium]
MKIAANFLRMGTESAFVVLAKAKKLEAEGKEIINLGIGQPDFRTPQHIVEAGKQALEAGHHGYTAANGMIELRTSVCKHVHKMYGATIDPSRVLITPGGKPTMYFAIMLFGEPGSEIIYPEPGFPIYESMINYSGAKAVPMYLSDKNNFSFNCKEVLSLINDKTRLLILNNPQNPTGGLIPKEQIDELAEGLKKFPHVAVLSDEIYSRQIYDNKKMPSFFNYPELYDRLIVLDGWSKTYAMTGWRLGWSVWPEQFIELVTRMAINSYSCVSAANQVAAIAALEGPHDFLEDMMKQFTRRRKLIVDGLNSIPGVTCNNPGGAFYVFPNVSGTGMTGEKFAEKCLYEAGVAIVPGTSFGKSAKDFVRFSFANSYENIEKALEKIKKIL